MKQDTRGLIFAGIAALMWGVLAIALKVALHDVPAPTVVWFRFLVAFLLMAIYLGIFQKKAFGIFRRPPWKLVAASVLLGTNYFGFIYGLSLTTPGNAQLFIQTGPLALALGGIFLFKEKITARQVVGFLLVTAGFILFYFRQLEALLGNPAEYNRGIFWIITGGLAWAGFSIFQKKLVQEYAAVSLNAFIFFLCTLLFLPTVKFTVFGALSTPKVVLLVFLGMNTVIAYGALALALKYTEAKKISIIVTLNPLITFGTMSLLALLRVTWIDAEHLDLFSIVGALLVLSGAVLVLLRGRKPNPS